MRCHAVCMANSRPQEAASEQNLIGDSADVVVLVEQSKQRQESINGNEPNEMYQEQAALGISAWRNEYKHYRSQGQGRSHHCIVCRYRSMYSQAASSAIG